jgi:heme-degrading monooxygenase HmoA
MIQVVWVFIVKKNAEARFEQAYGPGGEWARLFARYSGFLGTTLLRDTSRPRRYLTIDAWKSRADRERMLAAAAEEYSALDAEFDALTESEAEIGVFESSTAAERKSAS